MRYVGRVINVQIDDDDDDDDDDNDDDDDDDVSFHSTDVDEHDCDN